jgi:hypothetical protein
MPMDLNHSTTLGDTEEKTSPYIPEFYPGTIVIQGKKDHHSGRRVDTSIEREIADGSVKSEGTSLSIFMYALNWVCYFLCFCAEATFRYKSRDKARTDYAFADADVYVSDFDYEVNQYYFRKNKRSLNNALLHLTGRTQVLLADGRELRFHFPVVGVSKFEFLSFLSQRVSNRKDYEYWNKITKDNLMDYRIFFGYDIVQIGLGALRAIHYDRRTFTKIVVDLILLPMVIFINVIDFLCSHTTFSNLMNLSFLFFKIPYDTCILLCKKLIELVHALPITHVYQHVKNIVIDIFAFVFFIPIYVSLTVVEFFFLTGVLHILMDPICVIATLPGEAYKAFHKTFLEPIYAFLDKRVPLAFVLCFVAPIFEEIVKEYTGMLMPSVELSERIKNRSMPSQAIVPYVMHICTLYFEYDIFTRMFIHIAYNSLIFILSYVVVYFMQRFGPLPAMFSTNFRSGVPIVKASAGSVERAMEFAKSCIPNLTNRRYFDVDVSSHVDNAFESMESLQVELLSKILLIADHVINKRFPQIVTSIVAYGWAKPLWNLVKQIIDGQATDIETFVNWFFELDSLNDLIMYTSDFRWSKFLKFFPEKISISPTTKHIIPFLSLVVGSLFFQDFDFFSRFLENVHYPKFSDDVIADSVFAMFEGVLRIARSGDVFAFFQPPELQKNRKAVTDFLDFRPKLQEDFVYILDQSEHIISILNSSTDQAVTKQMNAVLAKKRDAEKTLESLKTRRIPFLVFIAGLPGSGKTVSIDMVKSIWGNITKSPIDVSEIVNVDLKVKHPVENKNPNARVLVVNEMKADCTQDAKSDMIPTEVMFQRFLDSAPLEFKAAAIEGKGQTFNKVELIIITTNEFSYKFETDVSKLYRRFADYALVIRQDLWDENKKCYVPFDPIVMANMDTVDMTRFSVGQVYIDKNHLTLEFPSGKSSTGLVFNYSTYIQYLRDRMYTHIRKQELKQKFFKNVCSCGVLSKLHYDKSGEFVQAFAVCKKPDVEIPEEKVSLCPKCFVCLEYHCNIYCNNTYFGLDPEPLFASRKPTNVTSSGVLLENESRTVQYTSSFYEHGFWFLLISFIFTHSLYVYIFYKSISSRVYEFIDNVNDLVIRIRYFRSQYSVAIDNYLYFKKQIAKYKKLIFFCATGAALYAFRKFWRSVQTTGNVVVRENTDLSSMEMRSITREVNFPERLRTDWKKPTFQLRTAVVEKQGVNFDQIQNKLQRNVFRFHFIGESETQTGWFVALTPQYLLMNAHYFNNVPHGEFKVFLGEDVISSFCVDKSCYKNIYHEDKITDTVLLHVPFHLPASEIFSYWATDLGQISQCEGYIVNGNVVDSSQISIRRGVATNKDLQHVWERKQQSNPGDCGTLSVLQLTSTVCIIGIVSYNRKDLFMNYQGGNILYKQDIEKAMSEFGIPTVINLTAGYRDVGDLSINSSYRNISNPYLLPIGTMPGGNSKFKSVIAPSPFNERIVVEKLSKPFGIPKQPRFVDSNGVFRDSFVYTFENLPQNEIYSPQALGKACDAFSDNFCNKVQIEYPELEISPMTLEKSFFGDPEQDIDRANFNSSMGSIYFDNLRTRKDLFKEDENGVFTFNQRFRDDFQRFHDKVLEGDLRMMHIKCNFKDELRPVAKLEVGSIRVFYTVDIWWNTLCRMYVGPIRNLLLDCPWISGMFGKMDSSSYEWDKFAKFLNYNDQENWSLIDMDFKNFDVTHRIIIIYVSMVFYKIARRFYKCDKAAGIVYRCVFVLSCKTMEHQRDLAYISAILPSGYDITLAFNGVANVLLMIYAFIIIFPEKDIKQFFDLVKPATQGDDNLSSVHNSVISEYNMETIAPIYRAAAYLVTNSTKSSEISKTISWEDARFLKRAFRYDEETCHVVAPIETDSIWKSLAFTKIKGTPGVSSRDVLSQCVDVAQREFYFYGREVFEVETTYLRTLCEEIELEVHWLTYDEIKAKFLAKELQMNWI